jgi:multidrug efflux pump subunit AcrB
LSVGQIYSALGANFGGRYVNDFTYLGRSFQVNLQADSAFSRGTGRSLQHPRQKPQRRHGAAPHGRHAETRSRAVCAIALQSIPTAPINALAQPGVSSGTAMIALERVAAQTLPEGFGYEWSGLSFQERQSSRRLR